MRDLYLVSKVIKGRIYPIIAFDLEENAEIFIYNNKANGNYIIDLIQFDPTY